MGFGIPAAFGAALADPAEPIVAIVGDGGFLMSAMDLACAAREEIPVVVIVFNDGYLNLIRMQQLQDRGRGSAVASPRRIWRSSPSPLPARTTA